VKSSILTAAIIWMPFARGGPYPRPAVIVTNPRSDETVKVVVCSCQSTYDQDALVELPYDPMRLGGHPKTRLKKRTFAVTTWQETIHISSLPKIEGVVPASIFERILDKIGKISSDRDT